MFNFSLWKKDEVACKACGRSIKKSEVFCRHCGARQMETKETAKSDLENMVKGLLASYQSVIKNHLPEASLRFQLGVIYKLKGMLDEAVNEFKTASTLDSKNVEYYLAAGNVESARRRYAEAIGFFKKAIELHPEYPDLHNNIGVAYYKKGDLDEAISEFKKAVEINPKYANAHNNLGITYRKKGLKAESDAEFKKAQDLDKDHVMADYELGKFYYSGGMFDEDKALKDIDTKTIGDLLFTAKMHKEALEQYLIAVKEHPDYADLHGRVGKAYVALGKTEEAKEEFKKALAINPNYQEAKTYLSKTA